MYNIAFVDDEPKATSEHLGLLKRFGEENGIEFLSAQFNDAVMFSEGFSRGKYDIIFLDVEMPYLDGMKLARKIRERDENVIIIFITVMAQYAIDGYTVNAFNFLVKPITYYNFSTTLKRALKAADKNRSDGSILIQSARQTLDLSVKDILYVEINTHRATYHTFTENISSWESMKVIAQKLEPFDFALCNSSYLVNLRYVQSVSGFTLTLSTNVELAISQSKRKGFMLTLTQYMGR